jgi:hypothetical protein
VQIPEQVQDCSGLTVSIMLAGVVVALKGKQVLVIRDQV